MSVFVATVVTMVAAGVETKGHIPIQATTTVGFREGFLSVTNIIFAYRKLNPTPSSTIAEVGPVNLIF